MTKYTIILPDDYDIPENIDDISPEWWSITINHMLELIENNETLNVKTDSNNLNEQKYEQIISNLKGEIKLLTENNTNNINRITKLHETYEQKIIETLSAEKQKLDKYYLQKLQTTEQQLETENTNLRKKLNQVEQDANNKFTSHIEQLNQLLTLKSNQITQLNNDLYKIQSQQNNEKENYQKLLQEKYDKQLTHHTKLFEENFDKFRQQFIIEKNNDINNIVNKYRLDNEDLKKQVQSHSTLCDELKTKLAQINFNNTISQNELEKKYKQQLLQIQNDSQTEINKIKSQYNDITNEYKNQFETSKQESLNQLKSTLTKEHQELTKQLQQKTETQQAEIKSLQEKLNKDSEEIDQQYYAQYSSQLKQELEKRQIELNKEIQIKQDEFNRELTKRQIEYETNINLLRNNIKNFQDSFDKQLESYKKEYTTRYENEKRYLRENLQENFISQLNTYKNESKQLLEEQQKQFNERLEREKSQYQTLADQKLQILLEQNKHDKLKQINDIILGYAEDKHKYDQEKYRLNQLIEEYKYNLQQKEIELTQKYTSEKEEITENYNDQIANLQIEVGKLNLINSDLREQNKLINKQQFENIITHINKLSSTLENNQDSLQTINNVISYDQELKQNVQLLLTSCQPIIKFYAGTNSEKGTLGENIVDNYLQTTYKNAIIRSVGQSHEQHMGDIIFTYNHIKCLIEVKNKLKITSADMTKFKNDMHTNINNNEKINCGIFVSLRNTRFPDKTAELLQFDTISDHPVIYLYADPNNLSSVQYAINALSVILKVNKSTNNDLEKLTKYLSLQFLTLNENITWLEKHHKELNKMTRLIQKQIEIHNDKLREIEIDYHKWCLTNTTNDTNKPTEDQSDNESHQNDTSENKSEMDIALDPETKFDQICDFYISYMSKHGLPPINTVLEKFGLELNQLDTLGGHENFISTATKRYTERLLTKEKLLIYAELKKQCNVKGIKIKKDHLLITNILTTMQLRELARVTRKTEITKYVLDYCDKHSKNIVPDKLEEVKMPDISNLIMIPEAKPSKKTAKKDIQ